jgi:hypothetical protein
MEEMISRFWEDLMSRPDGPLALRFILQPVVASFFAIRSGLKDGREGKPLYFLEMVNNPEYRHFLLKEGWKDIGKVTTLAVVLDIVYQLIQFHRVYPVETLLIAFILAVLPYLFLRGAVNRIVRMTQPKPS